MRMKKKIRFIINPFSGTGKKKNVQKLIEEIIDPSIFEYEVVYTKAPKHATELSKEAATNNYHIVVAAGGDGSVNEVARGLVGSKTAMAIIPLGSGNGLARHLKIPMDTEKAIRLINDQKMQEIDTVKINDDRFFNVAGVGFDAHVSWEFSTYGKRGFSSYIKVVMRELPKYRSSEYELTIDGKKIQKTAFLISFANGSQYGNDTIIAPSADISDGYMNVCIVRGFPFYIAPLISLRLFTKTVERSKYMEVIKAKSVVVKQTNITAHLDGEPFKLGNEITLNVDPKSLTVIIP
jgi:diacylglycerol kinase (ATP)